ncbi:tryptophan synthase subunit alpha [Paenibacillus apiarius]|uniref:tryptophan synthase subunit alpha n=1 Tax=Paenibacillus apiarius TaxID=46240 RepID=UPI00197CCB4E|nr:tryptophan synthase subunit alpha [Paenibacillus apiarius]MBN3527615.1 tryptophan synthase subunit alpha [Paenibacillus apiarius]
MNDTLTNQSNRLDATFSRLREEKKSALMPFFTLGDPSCDVTLELLLRMEAAGADIIELGIPYSDPLADGPIIERASARALTNGVTLADGFRIAKLARERGAQIPYVLFTYYNPVMQLGVEKFFQAAAEAQLSGVIIPDLPYEESELVRIAGDKYGIHLVPLVAPTSSERIGRITEQGRGFIYCVSSLGVTGVRESFDDQVETFVKQVRSTTNLPIAIGFGISKPEHVRRFSSFCDGVIVGSAIVRRIEESLPLLTNPETAAEGILQICNFVRQLKH